MIYILIGIFAYLLFFIYDINSVIFKRKLLYGFFFTGFLLIIGAMAGIIFSSRGLIPINIIRMSICGTIATMFLFLLLYTLFFALPFKDTYIGTAGPPKVCKSGVYALCRHPGVLWLMFLFLFLALMLQIPLLYSAALVFNLLNVLYVIFQDKWTFMQYFKDYDEYKKDTPFLIPNKRSIKRCLETLKK